MKNPSRFEHHGTLEIHSRQAKSIVTGRYRNKTEKDSSDNLYPIYGLTGYGQLLIRIWQQIRADDPYAELTLIEVERRIHNAFRVIKRLDSIIEKKLNDNLPGIQIELYQSQQPQCISLSEQAYVTTHAKLGARLVGVFDLLIRKLVTGKQFGVINTKLFNRYQYRASKVIRGVFAAPFSYRKLEVKRADIVQKTEKGIVATNINGPVPLDILTRKKHSEFGPLSSLRHCE